MKSRTAVISAVCTLGLVLAMPALADTPQPGQVDFGTFAPAEGKEYVEVNLPSSLINLAAKFVEKQEPEVAKLLNGLKQVRVNVIGLSEKNRSELEQRVQKVRTELSGNGWERLVTAQQKGQDVGVYLKMDADSAVQGLAVTVIETGKQAVFVNIVGDIKPEQLTMIGDRMNIDPLKELGVKKAEAEEKK